MAGRACPQGKTSALPRRTSRSRAVASTVDTALIRPEAVAAMARLRARKATAYAPKDRHPGRDFDRAVAYTRGPSDVRA